MRKTRTSVRPARTTIFSSDGLERLSLSSPEASRVLGIAPKTLRNWRANGTGPAYLKSGNRTLYRVEDLDAWLAAQVIGGAA